MALVEAPEGSGNATAEIGCVTALESVLSAPDVVKDSGDVCPFVYVGAAEVTAASPSVPFWPDDVEPWATCSEATVVSRANALVLRFVPAFAVTVHEPLCTLFTESVEFSKLHVRPVVHVPTCDTGCVTPEPLTSKRPELSACAAAC